MASMGVGKLHLGVIGLDRQWDGRHRPTLVQAAGGVEVTAIYDQVARRAEIEAYQFRCRAVHGLKALIASPEVAAIAWLAPQWFGAYPLELAIAAGKPICCAVPLPEGPAERERLASLLAVGNNPARVFWPTATDASQPWLEPFARLVRILDPSAAEWAAARAAVRAAAGVKASGHES